MPTVNLGRRELAKLAPTPGRAVTYYDAKLRGFGLRFHTGGAASWVLDYRARDGRKRRYVLGHPDTLGIGDAKEAASKLLARIELGADPQADRQAQRGAETVAELFDAYLSEHVTIKPRTAELYRGYVQNHIKPAWAARKASTITKQDVRRLHRKLGEPKPRGEGKPGAANRVLTFVSGVYTWAIDDGRLLKGFENPAKAKRKGNAKGIVRFPENAHERFLSNTELARLGEALRLAETTGLPWHPRAGAKANRAPKPENRLVTFDPWTTAAIRLLIFTGCRLREILHLRWANVDLESGFLSLDDSKSGRKPVYLNAPALAILAGLQRAGAYVIASTSAGTKDEKPRSDLQRVWARVIEHADLHARGKKGEPDYRPGLRLHDLRHTHAAIGAGSGASLQMIGRLLGHRDIKTTERYAHLADDPVRSASAEIGARIHAAMEGASASVTPIRGSAE